jgi:hypothetical protein
MDVNDPNYPIPIKKLRDHGYPFCTAIHYRESQQGRLITKKIRGRRFVLKKDADAWLNTFAYPPSVFESETEQHIA